jgi:hypothetical protein
MKTTFVILTSLLFVFHASQTTQAAGPSPGPPYRQCAPSGYNCNMLILVDKNGAVTVNVDQSLQWYPPDHSDSGQLIGVQNNSGSTIQSISLVATTTHPNLKHFCWPDHMRFVPSAPNINIVNIPERPNILFPPHFGSVLQPPYDLFTWLDWRISCDLVFIGGLPKGGTSYFSFLSVPYYPYFRAFLKPVVAYVSFPADIKEGETVTGTIKIYPSPSPTPVTLALTTTTGTGSAVFASPSTFTQSGSFQITGAQRSSTAGNIRLSAIANGQEVSKTYFSVSSTDLQFPTGIAKGKTATANVTISPSPSIGPVTLKLETTSGTGSAVFASNGSNTLDIYQSGDVQIRGVEASSTANNIKLSASTDGVQRASKEFSVVWVTISALTTLGRLSDDNDARNAYFNATGTEYLGPDVGPAFNGVEIMGSVKPPNFPEAITLRQTLIKLGCYGDQLNGSSPRDCQVVPGSSYQCPSADYTTCLVDIAGGSGDAHTDTSAAPNGHIYLWDAPGTYAATNQIWRFRGNFAVFALFNDSVVSNVFTWSDANSDKNENNSHSLERTYEPYGDNSAKEASIKTTFDLQ